MRTRKDSVRNPSPSKRLAREPKVADFKTAQEKPVLLLGDEQIEQDWRDTHPNDLRLGGTTQVVYKHAKVRREHRQAYVMRHWDQTDCQILFLTILGYTHKQMHQEMGITRQAIEKRVRRMCQQVGVTEEIQLVLWILGFLTLHADGKIS